MLLMSSYRDLIPLRQQPVFPSTLVKNRLFFFCISRWTSTLKREKKNQFLAATMVETSRPPDWSQKHGWNVFDQITIWNVRSFTRKEKKPKLNACLENTEDYCNIRHFLSLFFKAFQHVCTSWCAQGKEAREATQIPTTQWFLWGFRCWFSL